MIHKLTFGDCSRNIDGDLVKIFDIEPGKTMEVWALPKPLSFQGQRIMVPLFTAGTTAPMSEGWDEVHVVDDQDVVVYRGYFREATRSNYIQIQLQNGPIKEVGVNGCQIDDVLEWCAEKLVGFNSKIPCKDNDDALTGLALAVTALRRRRKDREDRQVEGTSNV